MYYTEVKWLNFDKILETPKISFDVIETFLSIIEKNYDFSELQDEERQNC